MKISCEILREILGLTEEEFEMKRRKKHFNKKTADHALEKVKKNSKRYFGSRFDDILQLKTEYNLKRDILKVLRSKPIVQTIFMMEIHYLSMIHITILEKIAISCEDLIHRFRYACDFLAS